MPSRSGDVKPLPPPPSWDVALAAVVAQPQQTLARWLPHLQPTVKDEYLHWDKLRRLQPPEPLTSDEWWLAIKFARSSTRRQLPFADERGQPFWLTNPDIVAPLLHDIDRRATARAIEEPEDAHGNERRRYLISAVMD